MIDDMHFRDYGDQMDTLEDVVLYVHYHKQDGIIKYDNIWVEKTILLWVKHDIILIEKKIKHGVHFF